MLLGSYSGAGATGITRALPDHFLVHHAGGQPPRKRDLNTPQALQQIHFW